MNLGVAIQLCRRYGLEPRYLSESSGGKFKFYEVRKGGRTLTFSSRDGVVDRVIVADATPPRSYQAMRGLSSPPDVDAFMETLALFLSVKTEVGRDGMVYLIYTDYDDTLDVKYLVSRYPEGRTVVGALKGFYTTTDPEFVALVEVAHEGEHGPLLDWLEEHDCFPPHPTGT